MAKILVYNNATNKMETYYRGDNDRMPYNVGNTLTVKEFRARSRSNLLWTDRKTMETWNAFRKFYGKVIPIGACFRRPWEDGHGKQSQHYAGTAFDTGQALPVAQREKLRAAAHKFGKWTYVEPKSISPTWVHTDKRYGKPACSAGYPVLSFGSHGNYVCLLQDALNALGFVVGHPDGIFGNKTMNEVKSAQRAYSLSQTGIVDCATWQAIVKRAVGIGKTGTVIG